MQLNISHEKKCEELLNFDEIRFVGIINHLGNLVAEGFKETVEPFETEEKRRMLYMQMVLEISMRKDFDNELGEIDYIASKRKNALMISIPFKEKLMLISASPTSSPEEIVVQAKRVFSKFKEDADV